MSSDDHRTLGQHLDLFSINEDVGIGLVLWHPKGMIVRRIIRNFWEEEHLKNGYRLVCTPHIAQSKLWEISGHLEYYRQNMYVFEKENEPYVVKPMNCPFHIKIYRSKPRSYRELPIRYAEWGTTYRYERSGTLHGLMRVRGFTIDDAHIFCTPDQTEEEIRRTLGLTEHILERFGFQERRVYLSTRNHRRQNRYMGSEQEWTVAEAALAEALETKEISYRKNPGEAVFYGPKIDINVVDAAGREWQCSTIQFDFNLPKRFNITYIESNGKSHRVVMIHRAILGAIERFFAILLESCEGNLPLWLAPVQVRVLPISHKYVEYAECVCRRMLSSGIRVEIDDSDSTISYKIRCAEIQKTPYMVIFGRRELKLKKIAVRKHGEGDLGLLTAEELIKRIEEESDVQGQITRRF